jgi:ABC-type nickel/cobalt efflux system permease component RcnA
MFLRILFFITISINSLLGCNLCALDIPNIHLNTTIEAKKDKTDFTVTWEFDEKFISTLVQYDENQNNKFDPDEQKNIIKALEDYLKQFNYLTNIIYTKKGIKFKKKMIVQLKNISSTYDFKDDGKLTYTFNFSRDFILKDDHRLYIAFHDKGNNFNFILQDVVVKNYHKTKIIKPEDTRVNIYFYNYFEQKTNKDINKTATLDTPTIEETSLDKLGKLLDAFKKDIQEVLKNIKETNDFLSYFWLLVFSFIYGVLHALGPGHGKSLVGAYFLSENKSTMKALNISLLIGVVHTFSALILTLSVYFILNMLFSNIFSDIEQIATKVSAVIIILIALYLLQKKYKQQKEHKAHHHEHHSCSCGGCSTQSTDLGVIISAGIVPCPGTVTIFLFTISLGIYFVGFLSAVFMSLGMSLIIFITAYLSSKVRSTASSNQTMIKLFEYGSLVFILSLGIMLLIF